MFYIVYFYDAILETYIKKVFAFIRIFYDKLLARSFYSTKNHHWNNENSENKPPSDEHQRQTSRYGQNPNPAPEKVCILHRFRKHVNNRIWRETIHVETIITSDIMFPHRCLFFLYHRSFKAHFYFKSPHPVSYFAINCANLVFSASDQSC